MRSRSIVRKSPDNRMVMLDFLFGTGGGKDFCTARAYELAGHDSKHLGRVYLEGVVWGDIGQNVNAKQEKEAYRLIDALFPELINCGLKSEGYVRYSQDEVLKRGLKPQFEI